MAVTSAVQATFSEAMNSATLTSSTFTLTGGGGAVAGTVAYSSSGNVATFTPSANLAYGTQYTATLATGVGASDGATLAAAYTWSFTTAAAPAPTVTTVTPANGATGVGLTATVQATFSEAMNSATITSSTFTLTAQGGGAVAGTVAYSSSGNVATFTPSASLAYSTQYTATITTGATASDGAALAAAYTWSFTTAAAPVPTVTAVTPISGATSVSVTTAVTAAFSQAMNAATLTNSTFTLTAQSGGAVAGAVSYNGTTATFTPAASLAYNTPYTATITTGATSSANAPLAANFAWSFTTAAAPVPTVTTVSPVSGATGVAITTPLTATFNQAMNSSTLTASTFTLAAQGGGTVTGTVSYDSSTSTATFTPSASLAYSTQYTATITTGAQDTAGGALASNYSWSFTTVPGVTVDFGTTYQTIRGFGGSTAWLGQLTTAQATALFNPSSGLGLSVLRVRIDPEGSAGSNWETSQWTSELNNAQEAQAANPNAIVFATPWTPPPSMKTSSTSQPYYNGTGSCSDGTGYCGGYLNPSSYAAYATYLEDFVTYFASNSVNLYGISMQNEPDYSNAPGENYESCSWTAQQMDSWIDGNASVLTTKLIMPESYSFSTAQASPSLSDPTAAGLIGIVAGHLYGASPFYYTQAENLGKDVWMTEHSLTPTGSQPAMSDALAAAEEVHNSMVTGQYNAYVWWWIWDDPSDGVNYGLINSSTTSPAPTYYGYALGQFSKFVQPGYVRASATATPASGVYASAYEGNGHFVIVLINSNATATSLAFAVDNASVTSLTPYQTTASGGLAQQVAVPVSGGQFNYTLPAQSITTLVQ